MDIVILPGVGFHNEKDARPLMNNITNNIPDARVTYFDWQHIGLSAAAIPFYEDPLHRSLRAFMQETIMDFEYTIQNAYSMEVPVGDLYIGHSAGSLVALTRNAPCIIFGSPAAIINTIDTVIVGDIMTFRAKTSRKVLNILNRNDPIGLPLNYPNVENFYYCSNWINPVGAHTDYWSNKTVGKKIVSKIKEWFI